MVVTCCYTVEPKPITMKRFYLFACCMILFCQFGLSQRILAPVNSIVPARKMIDPPINHPAMQKVQASTAINQENASSQQIWTVGSVGYNFSTLKAAVESPLVKDGDVIHLYSAMIKDGDPDLGIYIAKNLEIVGKSGDEYTVVSASGTEGFSDRRCFVIAAGYTVTLSNLIMSRGYAKEHWGGAIFNSGTLILNNCRITNNRADMGGGGICNMGSLTATGCNIDNNSSEYGGAIIVGENSSSNFEGVMLAHNHADEWGGGLHGFQGSFIVFRDSKLSGNIAEKGAGAINNWGTLHILNSDLYANKSTQGSSGAIHNSTGAFCTISDSRIYENTAYTLGGALTSNYWLKINHSVFYKNGSEHNQGAAIANFGNAHLFRVTLSDNKGYAAFANTAYYDFTQTGCIAYLTNCTVTNNHDDEAGGIELYDDNGGSTLHLFNSIVAGNDGGGVDLMQYNGTVFLNGNNIIGTTDSLIYFFEITDMFGVDPLFDDLTNVSGTVYHHPLKINSPAINAIAHDTENDEKAAGEEGNFQKVGTFDIGAAESDYDTYNTTVWSVWGTPNHNFDTLNNVVVVTENDHIWSDRVNNLILGPYGILDVNDTLEVKGKLFNYGTGRSLVLHENVPFVYDDLYRNPVFYDMYVTNDGISPIIHFNFDPVGQVDTIIIEYGQNGVLDKVYNTNKLIWNVGKQYENVRIPEPNFIGMSYRLRFANQHYNFVTDVRTATFSSNADGISLAGWKVYPNPAGKIVYLEKGSEAGNQVVNVSVRDINGRSVLSQEGIESNVQIDVSALKRGIYWLKCASPEGTKVWKLAITGANW